MATRVAVLMERDPDGGIYVHLAVDGQWVEIGDGMGEAGVAVTLHEIDAGAGCDGNDWFDGVSHAVREALQTDGKQFAASLLDAYRNPPGSHYIDNFDEAKDEFDLENADLLQMMED